MFSLVGLGLDLGSISIEAIHLCSKADRVYLETYTVEFPYKIQELEHIIGKKITPLTRTLVEQESFIEEARKKDIILLIYGNPLMATTHISLVLKCKKEGISYRVLDNASIFDAVSSTGLQIYKFGKTASMPKWQEKYKPDSFADLIKFNKAIKAHTLILVDIGLRYGEALKQLQEACKKKIKLEKLVVCSRLGTGEARIYYDFLPELYGKEVLAPFCIIIPSDLHFLEKEALESLGE